MYGGKHKGARLWAAPILAVLLSLRAEDAGAVSISVPTDTTVCCIGEYGIPTQTIASYWAQTFTALTDHPVSLTIGTLYNRPTDAPLAKFKFRVLLVDILTPGSMSPGAILYESGDLSTDQQGSYESFAIDLKGVALSAGSQYAWIIDTYATRDGVIDVGQMGLDGTASYSGGMYYWLLATENGRAADFAATWTSASWTDMSFTLEFAEVPEPASATIFAAGLLLVGRAARKRRA